MIRGLYTSGWSMLVNSKRLDVISNNLANVNTNAFKKDTVILESFPDVLTRRIFDAASGPDPLGRIGTMELGSDAGEIFTYYNQGQLVKTGNYLDLAIADANSAFFTVTIPDANGNMNEYYTRDGSFTLNPGKQLITRDGYLVMGENGPITLESGEFTVQSDGTVIQNGKTAGKLLVRSFSDTTTLRKFGSNYVARTAQTQEQPFNGKVMQEYLEQSNVNIVKEMVDMIDVMRAYEANQKLIQAQDGTLDKVVNEVGSVG